MPGPRGAQDVGGETAVGRTGLYEIETGLGIWDSGFGIRRTENREHLGELHREQLPEERPDVDARKKIARASRSAGRAAVVADLGVVEHELHERGHRQRAAL